LSDPESSSRDQKPTPSWWSRLLWFVLLWVIGVAAVAIVGGLIKLMLRT